MNCLEVYLVAVVFVLAGDLPGLTPCQRINSRVGLIDAADFAAASTHHAHPPLSVV